MIGDRGPWIPMFDGARDNFEQLKTKSMNESIVKYFLLIFFNKNSA